LKELTTKRYGTCLKIILISIIAMVSSCKRVIISPDGSLKAAVDGQTVNVSYHGQGAKTVDVTSIHLGLVTEDSNLDEGLVLEKASWKRKVNDDYEMVAGKRKHCHNEAYERVFSYASPDGGKLDVVMRVYNDGVALRYVLPEGKVVVDDCTAYTVPDGVKRWISPLKTDYESFFPMATDGGPTSERMWPRPAPGAWAFPALIEPSEGVFALISESDLRHGDSAASLDNSADSEIYKLKLTGPSAFSGGMSPWRVAIIGSLSDIVESTLITDLSSPAEFDPDWVEPGVSSWVYWAYNHGSKDFNLDVEFIDLAADMGWPYCLVDWEWPEMENGDIEELLDYAGEKGVKINLWYNSGTSWVGDGAPQPQDRMVDPEMREKEMQWLEDHGVNGIKVDFFLPDDASMVDYYLDILEDAARHHLTVDFHGCTVPRGWQRTWPNMMSMESVYGAEWYNNGPAMTTRAAAHNATIPFTRNVIGPMDYTPGTFSDSQSPHITTYAHELALPVLFESGLQHMPDRPDIYYGLPGEVRDLLSGLPSAWDDTRLLAGYPGEYAVIARLSGGRWYIAGINGLDEPRDLEVQLENLGTGTFRLFADGEEDRAFHIEEISAGQSVTIPCRARGGFVLVSE
jgi:hypothetical protein